MRGKINIAVAVFAGGLLTTGCTTVERNQVALGLCNRASWCTATEQRPESAGPPQVRAMEGRPREKVIRPGK